MKVDIKTPAAGESVSEAVIAAIFKESGSIVAKDEEILELETDKVNQVVHAPEAGQLQLTVAVDDVVKPEQVIGSIDTDVQGAQAAPPPPAPQKTASPPQQQQSVAEPASPPSGGEARQSVSAFVASVTEPPAAPPPSSPPQAKPARQDTARSPLPATGGAQRRERLSGLRRTIAKRLVAAKNETAMLTTFNEVDMEEVIAIRKRERDNFLKKHDVKLGFMSFFVKACVAALKEIPAINAFLDGDAAVYNDAYNVGISVSTDKGLMVPVIKNCDALSFAGVEKAIQGFAQKAREGSIAVADLQGGTFTITNGGVFGSMLSTPILNPPQSAILGMHNIVPRPVAIDGNIVIRPIMYLALSYDHRIVDGKESITFLTKVKEMLEKPERLLLDF
ncbi:MAG: 2-oxoglutarate dehydrogenase complex dihydrolipoyllysine-residue succinyltransferase [Chlamydiota bacterium]